MKNFLFSLLVILVLNSTSIYSQELEEFKIKRKDVFEFTQAPKLEKKGDVHTISFAVKDFCDVTVVIENAEGRIRRHLASGVLGKNPPKEFIADSLSQKVLWDGKDDEGVYMDNTTDCHVRVSLGLKPILEKRLFSTPYKRMANNAPLLAIDKSGVYAYEGLGSEFVKHFDHKGDYIKTVYPFPANKIKDVKGLKHFKSFIDGKSYPEKLGYNQATFLNSGTSCGPDTGGHYGGYAATSMTVRNGHLALAYAKLNRLGVDGSSNGMDFNGPSVSFNLNERIIAPTSIAFSPDNKYLYLTGYIYKLDFWEAAGNCYHVVYRMEYAKNEPPTVLIGKVDTDKAIGTDNKSFCVPTSLDVDDKGRLYVSDFGNNRIQIFSADGEHLKTIPTVFPAKVIINPKTQEIIVFSWKVIGPSEFVWKSKNLDLNNLKNTMSNLGTFENPKEGIPEVLPIKGGTGSGGWTENGGQIYSVVVDPYAEKESLWVVGRQPTLTLSEFGWSAGGYGQTSGWMARGIKIYNKLEGKWTETIDFAKKALAAVKRIEPPILGFQSLHFNPSDRHLYVGEDPGFNKSYDELIKINPENGELSIQPLPTNVTTLSFWYHDIAYLRTDIGVMRVNSKTWKEIPWDYGVEVDSFYFDSGSAPRRAMPSVSNLKLPPMRPVHWILMSMDVNAKGNLAVACYAASASAKPEKNEAVYQPKNTGDVYKLVNYPGRGSPYFVNIWDKSGKLIKEDSFPGMPFTDGLGLDKNNDIYVLIGGVRYLNEKDSFTEYTETLVKAVPNKGRIITTNEGALVALPKTEWPKRPPDITVPGFGRSWIENAEWMYGGVSHGAQGGCACWHGGFKLDLLGRSFVPESNQYQIAIIDSSGNLIMRVGQYCNADSYGATSPVPLGGNEIGMMMAHTVSVETDKRLFIADTGNERLLSVKLDYEVNVKVPMGK